MLRPFQGIITSETTWDTLSVVDLTMDANRAGRGICGREATSAVPFIIAARALVSVQGGAYSGAHLRVSWSVGDTQQQREMYLDDRPRRISGRAVTMTIEARSEVAGESVHVVGAVAWAPDADVEMSTSPVTDMVARRTLSFAQATTDSAIAGVFSLGALNREATALAAHASGLSGATTLVPVRVTLAGRRFVDDGWVRIGAFLLDDSPEGAGGTWAIMPGQFDEVGYRVEGFPSSGGGSSTLVVHGETQQE